MSNISLDSLIQLYQFSTGRRLYTFQRVLVEAIQQRVAPVEALAHDESVAFGAGRGSQDGGGAGGGMWLRA